MRTAALAVDTEPLARQLHAALADLDAPARGPGRFADVEARLVALRAEVALRTAGRHPDLADEGLWSALEDTREALGNLPSPSLPPGRARRAWARQRARLLQAYAAWSKALAAYDIHVPHLRPTNPARNVFHVAWATVAALILGLYPDRATLLWFITPIAAWAWTMEGLRRRIPRLNQALMAAFAPFAHPHEWHRVNSATWYASALLLLTLADVPTASMVALLVLGVGDPTAALIGRRFGRHALINGRTVEGTLAFFVAGTLVAWPAVVGFAGVPWLAGLAMAAAGAFAGAIAELVSRRIDDNLSIPLAAALAVEIARVSIL